MSDHGFVALGKYSSARDSILHFMCISDWANDSNGNSEAPTGYFWKISNTTSEVNKQNTETNSLLDEWFQQNPEVRDSVALRQELVGNFIVNEDSNGFIYVMTVETQKTLNEIYENLETKFYEWDDQGED
jgi:hypothetical protein